MKKAVVSKMGLVALTAFLTAGCDNTTKEAKIAVVTDVGQLMDGGFNQGTYTGAKNYAEANDITYNYYAPANGSNATDNDRIDAMESAIKNGAEIIVTPGYLQADALIDVATRYPDIKFVFVDGWTLTKKDSEEVLTNVTAITYKEQEAGYFAGYAVVKEGYTKLGGTFGGGGSNPACNRFGYGYAQGIDAAAKELNKNVELKVSYKYGSGFSASSELATQMTGWYQDGTEVIFSCGGSMVNSVISAANSYPDAKIIGVDTDQASLSPKIITSAQKELAVTVEQVLTQYYSNKWDAELGGKTQNLGASDDATGLPTSDESWRFQTFTKDEYNTLFESVKNGTIVPDADVAENCDTTAFWIDKVDAALSNVTITLDK